MLLLISAADLVWQSVSNIRVFELAKPRVPLAGGLSVGGAIGFIAGASGIGGGVILSPLMLKLKWANVRQTSAIAAFFIVVNSSSGLAGNIVSVRQIPSALPIWAGAVLLGGWIGSGLGSRRLSASSLIWLLAAALIVAGIKFILF